MRCLTRNTGRKVRRVVQSLMLNLRFGTRIKFQVLIVSLCLKRFMNHFLRFCKGTRCGYKQIYQRTCKARIENGLLANIWTVLLVIKKLPLCLMVLRLLSKTSTSSRITSSQNSTSHTNCIKINRESQVAHRYLAFNIFVYLFVIFILSLAKVPFTMMIAEPVMP